MYKTLIYKVLLELLGDFSKVTGYMIIFQNQLKNQPKTLRSEIQAMIIVA